MTADEARELSSHPLWGKYVNEIHKTIETEKERLVFAKEELDMVSGQERVKALRFASRFPEIIIDREEDPDGSQIITPGGNDGK
jgi:hypothetical protein